MKNPTPLGKNPTVKKPIRPGHGGKRPGAGRPESKATGRSKAAAERISAGILVVEEEFGELPPEATPLDVMIMAMRVMYKKGGAIAAQPFARDAAPYLHARIAQMELKNPEGQTFALSFQWAGGDDGS